MGKRPFEDLANDVFMMLAIVNGQLPAVPEGINTRQILDQRLWEPCKRCWRKYPSLWPSMRELLEDIKKQRQDDLLHNTATEIRQHVPDIAMAIGEGQYPWWQPRWLETSNIPSQWKREGRECFVVFNPFSTHRLDMNLLHGFKLKGAQS
jgi:hypothetical protein